MFCKTEEIDVIELTLLVFERVTQVSFVNYACVLGA